MTASNRVVVDSSGWLEYLTDDVNAEVFGRYLLGDFIVIVPTIVIYEVYKKLLHDKSKSQADAFASNAMKRPVVYLSDVLAISAARISIAHKLAMADAIIYATALSQNTELVTSDPHFQGLPGVVIPR
jgi:toxin FitB